MLENAELYAKLEDRKNKLESEVMTLNLYVDRAEKNQKQLKAEVTRQITEEGVYLLNHDLDRQDDFKNADEFF
ncbi:UNVERIFIED_CONTAM: hypothetical protein IGO34_36580, partial [Salmonella enterica subsp. enterica serovar Weltevreden]